MTQSCTIWRLGTAIQEEGLEQGGTDEQAWTQNGSHWVEPHQHETHQHEAKRARWQHQGIQRMENRELRSTELIPRLPSRVREIFSFHS